ncbi:PqqD family protein [Desmospora profundinema]|uniref:PqqD family protein n=1 Tax=Desmospora profundinema TaxID=1571184 RepID=A0ABU1IMY5_9BACL|nr:PqqD family protein [Desmospora profundinema]MDR6226129.1 hypothetical protein [Desmospora profundinema]
MSKIVPSLSFGVTLTEEAVYDEYLDASVPVNETAHVILTEVDGEKGIGEIVDNLAKKFHVEEEVLSHDIGNLFKNLNQNYLLNWRYQTGNRVKDIVFQFLSQYKPGYHERFEMNETGFLSIFLKMLGVVIRKIVLFWSVFMVLAILSFLYTQSDFILQFAYYFTVVYFGLITGFALHETMHAYVHRRMEPQRSGFLAADWMSIRFVRPVIMPYPKKMIWVTLLGPLVPGMTGVLGLLLIPVVNTGNMVTYTLLSFFATYSLHLLYLLPFTGDGKSIMSQLAYVRLNKKAAAKQLHK